MTNNRKLTLALGFTTLLGGVVAQAEQIGRAKVPFAFEVSGKKMEAGVYEAKRTSGGATAIQNAQTGATVYLMPRPAALTGNSDSTMTFACYGTNCFLSKVKFGDTQREYNVPRSVHEKELVAGNSQPVIELVAMR